MKTLNDAETDLALKPLNEAIDRLRELQSDPHPGLFTWKSCMMIALLSVEREAKKLTGKT